jgi:GAF domain-containing protein
MFDWIKRFVAAPEFEAEAKQRSAQLLNLILLSTLAATVVGTALILPVEPEEWLMNLVFGAIITMILLGLRHLMHRGKIRLVGAMVSVVLWGSITFLLYVGGGAKDVALTGYFLAVAVSGVFLGGRGALIFGGLSIIATVGMLLAELGGAMDFAPARDVGMVDGVTLTLTLGLTALLLRYTVRSMNRALAHAQEEERTQREANRALQEIRTSLEQRIRDRTQDLEQRSAYLEVAAEISQSASSILERDRLVQEVAELIRERLDLYYVGLFLIEGNWAVLQAGTGEAGQAMISRGHRLKVGGESMIGWATAQGQARIAQVTQEDTVQLATPELPETRAEAALPLRSRGQVIGALTVQSERPGAFDPDLLAALQTMADQVAVALDNARLFTELEEALEAERQAYGELSRQAWAELLREQAGLSFLCDARGVVSQSTDPPQPEMMEAAQVGRTVQVDGSTVDIPVAIRGHVAGVVRLRKPDDTAVWTREEIELMEALTEELGQALESARLYQDTQRRAAREQLVGEVSTRVRESMDLETVLRTAATEIRQALDLDGFVIRLATQDSDGDSA